MQIAIKNSKFLFLIIFFIIYCEKNDLFFTTKKTFTQKSEWIKLPNPKSEMASRKYFITVSVSPISSVAVERKGEKELISLIYGYLTGLTPAIKTEFDFLLKDLTKEKGTDVIQRQNNTWKFVINM